MAVGKAHGMPEDALAKLPQTSQSMVAKVTPVRVKAVLGNAPMIRQLLSAALKTLVLHESSEIVKG
eukprot:7181204-Pyramimonas_sp.AAC.1